MKKSDRNLIYQKFGERCAYCGCELPDNRIRELEKGIALGMAEIDRLERKAMI